VTLSGPVPLRVHADEELRRVPFLGTRAAATEIGASIEFNKAEGVDRPWRRLY
jgi:hypothetical protein